MARFLGFYGQYTLDDLRRMPPQEYLFLLCGMLDVTEPALTEPFEDRVARATRAAAAKARNRRR